MRSRRGLLAILPITGIITILSGIWLYWHASVGFNPDYMRSRPGMTYGLGMVVTIIAFLIGFAVIRPSVEKAATAPPAEAQKYSARAAKAGSVVAGLLIITVL